MELSDGEPVDVCVRVTARLDDSDEVKNRRQWKEGDDVTNIMTPALRKVWTAQLRGFSVPDVLARRAEVSQAMREAAVEIGHVFDIRIVNTALTRVKFSEQLTRALEAAVKANGDAYKDDPLVFFTDFMAARQKRLDCIDRSPSPSPSDDCDRSPLDSLPDPSHFAVERPLSEHLVAEPIRAREDG